jgi:hypothetical protein
MGIRRERTAREEREAAEEKAQKDALVGRSDLK